MFVAALFTFNPKELVLARIPFKPRESPIREMLKTLKVEFDKPHPIYEQTLWRLAELSRHVMPDVNAYLGEIYHQLGLRAQMRGDYSRAIMLYDRSIAIFRDRSEPLGLARSLREKAICIALAGDEAHGLEIALEALAIHKQDFNNPKGKRQELITRTYVWRIELMLDPKQDPGELIKTVLDPHQVLNDRDHMAILEFLIPRVDIDTRVTLKMRLSLLNAKRMRKLETVRSASTVMIDIPIVLTSWLVRRILGKE